MLYNSVVGVGHCMKAPRLLGVAKCSSRKPHCGSGPASLYSSADTVLDHLKNNLEWSVFIFSTTIGSLESWCLSCVILIFSVQISVGLVRFLVGRYSRQSQYMFWTMTRSPKCTLTTDFYCSIFMKLNKIVIL
uniref:Uncharacterized protein n=1 Tax=Arundo donax TaxID=35708 RepID=A0A0A9U6C2_ARUDO